MDLKIFCAKQFYQSRLKINQLTERDRILLLFISIVVLLGLWYLVIFHFQQQALSLKNQKINEIQTEIANFNQKKLTIKNLVNNSDAASLLARYKDLTNEMAKLNAHINNYNKRYINSNDLSKLMHGMLKQTMGVIIEDFSTFVPPPVPITQPISGTAQPSNAQPLLKVSLSLEPTHYRLVMRGSYFPIMYYLKRLEELPWHLYWDKFNYTVSKYPEGVAIMEFYTLKPVDIQQQRNP